MTDSTKDNCIFCKIIKGGIPSTKVYETEDVLAFNDISPGAPLHIIIVPKNHIGTLEEIDEQNYDITGKLILAAAKIARQKKLAGYRLVMNCNEIAGQTIFHIHCHLLAGRQMSWPPG